MPPFVRAANHSMTGGSHCCAGLLLGEAFSYLSSPYFFGFSCIAKPPFCNPLVHEGVFFWEKSVVLDQRKHEGFSSYLRFWISSLCSVFARACFYFLSFSRFDEKIQELDKNYELIYSQLPTTEVVGLQFRKAEVQVSEALLLLSASRDIDKSRVSVRIYPTAFSFRTPKRGCSSPDTHNVPRNWMFMAPTRSSLLR